MDIQLPTEQAAHHERLADAIDRQQRDLAKLRIPSPDVVEGGGQDDP
jgi:hypothetical protein